jgi:hypothetical protein
MIDIISKTPHVLDMMYEKIRLGDDDRVVSTGVPSIVAKCAQTICETLDMSLALVQTVSAFIVDNPSNPDNCKLCLCINTLCDEIRLLKTRMI